MTITESFVIPVLFGIIGGFIGSYIQHQFDKKSAKYSKLTETQFDLFQKLWDDLSSLKVTMDQLWENPQATYLSTFSDKIRKLSAELERKKLILTERDYYELRRILDSLSKYEGGKSKLITVNSNLTQQEINSIVDSNRIHKKEYEKLLDEMYIRIRKKIAIEND